MAFALLGLIGCASAQPTTMPAPTLPVIPSAQFSIMDYGAVADGSTLNTQAIQKAIDACAAAGGGHVIVPAGTFLTGPIHLASNIDLHVDEGAKVFFSRNLDDYPMVFASFEGRQTVQCSAPISGDNLTDISITGPGVFDGNGDAWRPVKKEKLSDAQWDTLVKSGGWVDTASSTWYPSKASRDGNAGLRALRASTQPVNLADYARYRDLLKPPLMLLSNCKQVLLDGPTFRNSPVWNLHPYLCDDLTVRNITIYNEIWAQNGDGIDFDSCRNVLMIECSVNAGDDDICLKSGRDSQGRALNRPTENVTITNCTIGHGHGGITIGSEMSGGVRNVYASNCVMNGTDGGLRFKTTRGRGGVVENIWIDHIKMSNIRQDAIQFNMYYMVHNEQPEPVSDGTPQFRNFHISDITCASATRR